MSHTVTVSIELRNREALAAAVVAMGGSVLGEGLHRLYSSNYENGYGFRLPGWNYPLVLRKDDNSLAFDDYHGHWGNVKDLDRLKGLYAIEAARLAADAQGWISESQADGTLLIYHPSGATMTVSADGTVDANGFVGTGCDAAAAIENALGQAGDRINKAEYFHEVAHVREG